MRVETSNNVVKLVYAKGEIACRRPVVILLWHERNQRELIDLSVLGHIDCGLDLEPAVFHGCHWRTC